MGDKVLSVNDLIERQNWQGFFSVGPADTIQSDAEVMQKRGVSAISIVEDDRLVGVLSEKDIARLVAEGKNPETTQVQDLMTRDVVVLAPDMSLGETAKIMLDNNIRHLPVVDGKQLITMLSIRDVLRLLIDRLETENKVLRSDVEWLQYYQR